MLNNYWDWLFPYFGKGLYYFFYNQAFSWNASHLGAPTGYLSSYYFYLIFSVFKNIAPNPEWILLLLLLLILGGSVIFAYEILGSINKPPLSTKILISLAVVINPAIYYKLLAGHLVYLVSYAIFLCFLWFLVTKFNPKKIFDWLVLGLLLGLVGQQIQFFAFVIICLLLYFLIYKKFVFRYGLLALAVALIINLPWLLNFIAGAAKISNLSHTALEASFSESMYANPARILMMAFSGATNIQYAFSKPWFVFFGLITILILLGSIIRIFNIKDKNKLFIFLFSNWIVFLALSTGFYNKLPIPYIKKIYPMFREVGHFAPLILVFGFLLFGYLVHTCELKIYKTFFSLVILLFVIVNISAYIHYLPWINYQWARNQFNDTKIVSDSSTYRIMEYPFWDQYKFINMNDVTNRGKLLNNSGWDSFLPFSSANLINNYISGNQSINKTIQYNLLKTNNISDLAEKNIKYIYDLSSVYESNLEKYVAPETYENDLSLIKNDSNFITKLLSKNTDLKKIASNVYEITDSKPRISSTNLTFQKITPSHYELYLSGVKSDQQIIQLESFSPEWKMYLSKYKPAPSNNIAAQYSEGQVKEMSSENIFWDIKSLNFIGKKPIFENSAGQYGEYGKKWVVNLDEIKQKGADYYKENQNGTVDIVLTLLYRPQPYQYICLLLSLIIISTIIILLMIQSISKIRMHDPILEKKY